MSEQQQPPNEPRPQPREGRLPYERPQVVSDEVFETMALSCANANRFQCPGGPDRS
ncbi:MAG: hypothetical protein H6708_03930 [Kofleriaceae bacterium]|nr:hypothetical protein [Myxococcales bacterium]MCB9559536.1 hypothetical protein [Kofleriaceae bacterium]